jgi:hypothetical protein
MSTEPYKIVRQANLKAGKTVYLVEKADPVPPSVSILTGDAIQNLRTALDYLAYSLVIANKADPTDDTSFPILRGDVGSKFYKATFEGKVKGMRYEAIEKIKSLNPYKGGHDTLYSLHALNNREKHRLLLAAGNAVSRVCLEPLRQKIKFHPENLEQALSNTLIRIPGAFPLYEGQEISIDPPRSESHEDVTLFAR